MMFDNSPAATPSRWDAAREHLPIALVVFAAVGVAAGLHLASTAVAVAAGAHVVLGGAVLMVRRLRARHTSGAGR